MEIIRQPILIDQIRLLVSSRNMCKLRADVPDITLYGLTKKQMTQSAREFAEHNPDLLPKFNPSKPFSILSFAEHAFQSQQASSLSVKAYNTFTIRIFGNPTRFQKHDYMERGLIDQDLNDRVRLHDDNYIHTNLCNVPIEHIEEENWHYLPNVDYIEQYVSQEVLGHDPYMESPTLYTDTTISYLEVNQDLLTPEYNSLDLIKTIIQYFQTQDGIEQLYQADCTGYSAKVDLTSQGVGIFFDFDTKGKLKVYPKTQHCLRVEAVLYGDRNITPQLGSKPFVSINRVIEDLAKPLLRRIDIPAILQNQPTAQDLTPWIFDLLTDDPKMLNIANKLHQRRFLTKDEIPVHLRRKGKNHKFKGIRHGKIWHYVPKHLKQQEEELIR